MRAADRTSRTLIEAYLSLVRDRAADLKIAGEAFDRTVSDAFAPLLAAVQAFNVAVDDYNGSINDLIADLNDFIGGKGERWRESHAEGYEQWRQALEEAKVDEIDEPEPPVIEIETNVSEEAPPLSLREITGYERP